MRRTRALIRFCVCGLGLVAASVAGRGQDAELDRTWRNAMVFAPAGNSAGYERLEIAGLETYLAGQKSRPTALILYAHGCDGLSEISRETGRFLARAGYVLVAPDSFARLTKPVSCDPTRRIAGLHRAALRWRQDELRYADGRIATITGLRDVPVVLMGHSEGAIAVATLTDAPAAARIMEGWTCHAGWPEYQGSAAPVGQPVLALVGESDPWFEAPVLHGDCGAYLKGPRQRSLVYRAPDYLAGKHWLSSDPATQVAILDFLNSAVNEKGN
jgi:dienelactone hydrolase